MVTIAEFLERGKPELWFAPVNSGYTSVMPARVAYHDEGTHMGRNADRFKILVRKPFSPDEWSWWGDSTEHDEVYSRCLFFTEHEAQLALAEDMRRQLATHAKEREAIDRNIAKLREALAHCEERSGLALNQGMT